MVDRAGKQPKFSGFVIEDPERKGALRISLTVLSEGTRSRVDPDAKPACYIAIVNRVGDQNRLEWLSNPPDSALRQDLENDALRRAKLRRTWIERLHKLVNTVKTWAEELEWATKVVDRKLEDPDIGAHIAPALLLQNEAVKLFLEPVSRVAPGTEGVVDLYLMPSYDDICSLYYYNGKWNVHYAFGDDPHQNRLESESRPLTKSTLKRVFDEMKFHAG